MFQGKTKQIDIWQYQNILDLISFYHNIVLFILYIFLYLPVSFKDLIMKQVFLYIFLFGHQS